MLFMMKYIRATFLWLAGLTLISHSVLPHHHVHKEDSQSHYCINEHVCEDEENASLIPGNYENHSNQKNAGCIISHNEISIPVNDFINYFTIPDNLHETSVFSSVVEVFFPESENPKETILTELPPRSPPLS